MSFSYNLPTGTLSSALKTLFFAKILCENYFAFIISERKGRSYITRTLPGGQNVHGKEALKILTLPLILSQG